MVSVIWKLYQVNSCSLKKNTDDFEHIVYTTKLDFDIVAIS